MFRVVTPTGHVRTFQHPRKKPCALGSLSIPFSDHLEASSLLFTLDLPVLTVYVNGVKPVLCLVQHIVPCDVHDKTLWRGRPFTGWWVLRLLTLGAGDCSCCQHWSTGLFEQSFSLYGESIFWSRSRVLLSWLSRCQTFPRRYPAEHPSLPCLCSAHILFYVWVSTPGV